MQSKDNLYMGARKRAEEATKGLRKTSHFCQHHPWLTTITSVELVVNVLCFLYWDNSFSFLHGAYFPVLSSQFTSPGIETSLRCDFFFCPVLKCITTHTIFYISKFQNVGFI